MFKVSLWFMVLLLCVHIFQGTRKSMVSIQTHYWRLFKKGYADLWRIFKPISYLITAPIRSNMANKEGKVFRGGQHPYRDAWPSPSHATICVSNHSEGGEKQPASIYHFDFDPSCEEKCDDRCTSIWYSKTIVTDATIPPCTCSMLVHEHRYSIYTSTEYYKHIAGTSTNDTDNIVFIAHETLALSFASVR